MLCINVSQTGPCVCMLICRPFSAMQNSIRNLRAISMQTHEPGEETDTCIARIVLDLQILSTAFAVCLSYFYSDQFDDNMCIYCCTALPRHNAKLYRLDCLCQAVSLHIMIYGHQCCQIAEGCMDNHISKENGFEYNNEQHEDDCNK